MDTAFAANATAAGEYVAPSVLNSSTSDHLAVTVEHEIPRALFTTIVTQKKHQAHGNTGVAAAHEGSTPAARGIQCTGVSRLLLPTRASDNQQPLTEAYGATTVVPHRWCASYGRSRRSSWTNLPCNDAQEQQLSGAFASRSHTRTARARPRTWSRRTSQVPRTAGTTVSPPWDEEGIGGTMTVSRAAARIADVGNATLVQPGRCRRQSPAALFFPAMESSPSEAVGGTPTAFSERSYRSCERTQMWTMHELTVWRGAQ